MKKGFFITGTDTDVGKTWVTVALMHYFKQQELSVIGLKPVAAGCKRMNGRLVNDDALLLQKNASLKIEYEKINPYAFELPVSPHLAAGLENVDSKKIVQIFEDLKEKVDLVVVEGAGGWFAPLSDELDIADLAKALNIPVIMVVAIKLGCINHARLTFQAIRAAKVPCVGWFAVCIDPFMLKQHENIESINNKISVPLLGVFPHIKKMDAAFLASKINGEKLI